MSTDNTGGMGGSNPYQYYGSEAQVLGDQFRATMRAKDQAARHSSELGRMHDAGWNDAIDAMTPKFNQLNQQIQAQQSRIAELERKVIAIARNRDEIVSNLNEWSDYAGQLEARNKELAAERDQAVSDHNALAEVVTSLREANARLQDQR